MAYEHASGVPGAFDRTEAFPDWSGVIAREGFFAQAADLNEIQSMQRRRTQRIGELVARDGDRKAGANIVVDTETGTVSLTEGLIFAQGDVRSVAARTFTGVELAGDVEVGIRLATIVVTEEDEPALYGQYAGAPSEGEPGSVREIETASWALSDDGGSGRFFSVYQLKDGTPLDQTPPPSLTGITQAIAQYDRGSNGGNYISSGCRVTALDVVANKQQFSIQSGEATIFGFKRIRDYSLRHAEERVWEVEHVPAEPHAFADGGTGTAVIRLNFGPIDYVESVVITREVTRTLTRGNPNNTSDLLEHNGVSEIVSVSQAGVPFATNTYKLESGRIDWSPAGAEPAVGTSYQITYRYLDTVIPTAVDADTITVTGGVTGTQVIVEYNWRLPRIDLLCLDQYGSPVYVRGAPARSRPVPPIVPVTLLALAEIAYDWRGPPAINNNGTRNVPYPLMWRVINELIDLRDLMALERLKREIDTREPNAKYGIFVDPAVNDYYRDQGVEQDAAVFNGSIQLALDVTFHEVAMAGPIMLPWVEEIIIEQPLVTRCVKINPYGNFTPLPGQLTVTPSTDFWTVSRTEWLSDQTRQISGTSNRTTTSTDVVDQRQEFLEFLRPISIAFTVKGLGTGELLEKLLFDGIDVTPDPPLVGDANGEATGTFSIPEDVVAGTKLVEAHGASGMEAFATFVGQGRIDITTMRRTTLVQVAPTPIERRPRTNFQLRENDPQAQSFATTRPRHLVGVDLKICKIGDANNAVILDLVTMDAGNPSTNVLASALLSMTGVTLNAWTPIRWPAPAFVDEQIRAFVVKTDDNEHSIAMAKLGDYDLAADKWVSAQPYTVGDNFDGSNAISWLVHPDRDVTFRIVAARFTATTRTVLLGTINLVDCSDLLIAAVVELPTADCRFHFEVKRAGGSVIQLAPGQVHEFTEYVTETVQLFAVLAGTELVSPTLFPGVTVIAGKLRPTGTYVSSAFEFGTGIRLPVRFKGLLPPGSGVTVAYDLTDNNWIAIPLTSSEALNDGWAERLHEASGITGVKGRIKLTLAGTPAARLSLADLRVPSTTI